MKKTKLLVICTIIMLSIYLIGCSSKIYVPEKTETVEKIEKIVEKEENGRIEVNYFEDNERIFGNDTEIRGSAGFIGFTCYFNDDNELIAISYITEFETYHTSYCVYGSAKSCYKINSSLSLKECKEMKKEGEVLKQKYKDLLKKYDITTGDIKEYAQYEYSYKLSQKE